jgi:hypothetical protein
MCNFSLPPQCEISYVLPQSSAWPLLMASTVYPKMPINYQWNSLFACLTLTNGTYRMSQNVDNKLPTKQSFLTAWPLLIAPTVCPIMSVTNYQSTLRKITEERRQLMWNEIGFGSWWWSVLTLVYMIFESNFDADVNSYLYERIYVSHYDLQALFQTCL